MPVLRVVGKLLVAESNRAIRVTAPWAQAGSDSRHITDSRHIPDSRGGGRHIRAAVSLPTAAVSLLAGGTTAAVSRLPGGMVSLLPGGTTAAVSLLAGGTVSLPDGTTAESTSSIASVPCRFEANSVFYARGGLVNIIKLSIISHIHCKDLVSPPQIWRCRLGTVGLEHAYWVLF